MITFENGKLRYFDKHGREIAEGCIIRYTDGCTREVYRTNQDELVRPDRAVMKVA